MGSNLSRRRLFRAAAALAAVAPLGAVPRAAFAGGARRIRHPEHFVLVHGAWHGAWCWYKVTAALEAAGHRVTAIDLPSAGIDGTPGDDRDPRVTGRARAGGARCRRRRAGRPGGTQRGGPGRLDRRRGAAREDREARIRDCRRDRAVTFAAQRAMLEALPCERTFTIDSDHSPFLSHPAALVRILGAIARA